MSKCISYEELLFAICQEIGGNRAKQAQFYEALESYIKEWEMKALRSIKLHKKDTRNSTHSDLGIASLFNPGRGKTTLSASSLPLKDFLSTILSSFKCRFPEIRLLHPWTNNYVSNWDRYRADFDEISLLGTGGFGRVYRVKHILDGKEYAVKKVPLGFASPAEYASLLREVRFLSEMNHPNVAHYYSSWLQLDYFVRERNKEDFGPSLSRLEITDSLSLYPNHRKPWLKPGSKRRSTFLSSTSSIVFDYGSDCVGETKSLDNGGVKLISTGVEERVSKLSFASNDVSSKWKKNSSSSDDFPFPSHRSLPEQLDTNKSLVVWRGISLVPTLFIQMELGSESLLSWIEKRNERARNKTFTWTRLELMHHFNIFKNILSALEYIHSKGILHRDIKPANILISAANKNVLLADFGLATLSLASELKPNHGSRSLSFVGTPPYSAPEVKTSMYDNKVDIYSLGIILLELMCPFASKFERARTIELLKKEREVIPSLTGKWGYFSHLLLGMTHTDPRRRPTASVILQRLQIINDTPSRGRFRSSSSFTEAGPSLTRFNTKLPRCILRRSATFPGSNTPCTGVVASRKKRVSIGATPMRRTRGSSWLESLKRKDAQIKLLKQRVKDLECKIKELEKKK